MMSDAEILNKGLIESFVSPSHYPISIKIADIASQYGNSPVDVVSKLAFRNIKRSARHLNRWIGLANSNQNFLDEFAKRTNEAGAIKVALEATKNLRLDEANAAKWRKAEENIKNFVPFIEIITEQRRPNQIFVEAVTGGRFKTVKWEQIEGEKLTEARIRVGLLCKANYEENNGLCVNWGKIEKYFFVESWNRYVVFDTQGNILEIVEEPHFKGMATLSVGGREGVEKVIK